jgi:hypothetical protein
VLRTLRPGRTVAVTAKQQTQQPARAVAACTARRDGLHRYSAPSDVVHSPPHPTTSWSVFISGHYLSPAVPCLVTGDWEKDDSGSSSAGGGPYTEPVDKGRVRASWCSTLPYPRFSGESLQGCSLHLGDVRRAVLLGGGAAAAMTVGAGQVEATEGARLMMDLAEASTIAGTPIQRNPEKRSRATSSPRTKLCGGPTLHLQRSFSSACAL